MGSVVPAVATTSSPPSAPTAAAPPRAPGWGLAALALAAATVVLRLPAFVADRHLTVDDGVFGASALAMRTGALPFREVFSSQGPLFLPLVWVADVAGFRTLDAPRLLALASGVALVLAVLAAAREITDRPRALLAAGLTAATGSVLWVTAPIASDGPALALATGTVALAFAYRRSPSVGRALAAGACLGAAVSVKALLAPAAVPLALVLLATRRPRHLAAAAAGVLAVVAATHVPWGLEDVWAQSYQYHLDAAGDRTPGANARKVLSTLGDRDLPVVAVAVVAAVAALLARRRSGHPATTADAGLRPSTGLLLWSWLAATVLVLLTEHPLWRPHISFLVPPVVLLAVRRPLPWAALGLVAVLVVPYHAVHLGDLLWPDPPPAADRAVVASLRDLPEGAQAISDQPGLVWRAGRQTPPDAVDASILRIDSEREGIQVTARSLAAQAAQPEVCAVAVWSNRYAGLDGLPERLADAGYRVAAAYGGPRVLYERTSCSP
ncbi:MAG: Dolichyl-phosphate-mannose-protein mannosyltransferase [Acidimicrobiales bacterium]|nr:Dolichyl-phosphate-mannose-protein mannosyltransferase [Acidimicrobiales bacterium]